MRAIWKREKVIASISATAIVMLFSLAALEAADWKTEMVDQTTGPGRFASMKIDKDGNAHVAYVVDDGIVDALKYAFWDHSLQRWFTMVVSERAGFSSLTLDSKQHPRISYTDWGGGSGAKLRYAVWDGTAWQKQAIPVNANVIGYYTSIALDSMDNPTISFYEYEGPRGSDIALRLRSVSWTGSYWELRTVDGQRGSGKFNSIAIDSAGHPAIAYANVQGETSSLRLARWNGDFWRLEVLEGVDHPLYMHSVAMVFDKEDNPHIAYTDAGSMVVKYATRRNGRWEFQVVDSLKSEAFPDRHGITVDAQGIPYISYYDAGLGRLNVAYLKDQKWVSEVVDQNFAGATSSVQVAGGEIWVTYADDAGRGLKFAHRPLEQAVSASQQKSNSVPR